MNMLAQWLGFGRTMEVPCTVTVENTFDFLNAHVELPDGVRIEPGDEVIVEGDPVDVAFGQTGRFERTAKIVRAHPLERLWTRMTGDLEFMELLEFSFSTGSRL
jgi:hypothetical protein